MTEVEFAHLLAELTTTAKVLNNESDSINGAITAVEAKLRQINLGLEVWLDSDPIESSTDEEEGHDGEMYEAGSEDEELGFAKSSSEWSLMVRLAKYKYETDRWGNREPVFKSAATPTQLLECSRKVRIEAIKRLPALVKLMNAEAKAALEAIEAAKKLVK